MDSLKAAGVLVLDSGFRMVLSLAEWLYDPYPRGLLKKWVCESHRSFRAGLRYRYSVYMLYKTLYLCLALHKNRGTIRIPTFSAVP